MKKILFNLIGKILYVMTLSIVMESLAFAIPVADGRFDPSEGYTSGHYVHF